MLSLISTFTVSVPRLFRLLLCWMTTDGHSLISWTFNMFQMVYDSCLLVLFNYSYWFITSIQYHINAWYRCLVIYFFYFMYCLVIVTVIGYLHLCYGLLIVSEARCSPISLMYGLCYLLCFVLSYRHFLINSWWFLLVV